MTYFRTKHKIGLVMKEKVERAILGIECPKCGHDHLYKLDDGRYKCSNCKFKYSPRKLNDDLQILHYFSLEIPANKARKDFGCSYDKVRRKYPPAGGS